MSTEIKIKFPHHEGFFNTEECLKSAVIQNISLEAFDVQVANLALDFISEWWQVPRVAIINYGRKRECSEGRPLFVHTALTKTEITLRSIGGFLSGRDHSTVSHLRDLHKERITSQDESFQKYQEGAVIMDQCMKKIKRNSNPNEIFSIMTIRKRISDLSNFSRTIGVKEIPKNILEKYVLDNPIY